MSEMRNVLLSDNQDITRAGWKFLLSTIHNDALIVDVYQKKELVDRLLQHADAVVILDYTLFDFEDVNDLQILQLRFPNVDWIIFSDELSSDFLQTLLYNTQSFSVVLKDSSKEEIISAFKGAHAGKRFICSHVSNLLIDSVRDKGSVADKKLLTATEQEILKEMALGKTTKEIATIRFLSVHTIMTHRKNIFRKLNVNNVHEATKYAMRAGIVDLAEYYI